jgi:hypothetical protein
MIRAIACLVDRQRAAIERLGLGETVRVSKQRGERVETDRDHGTIAPVDRFIDAEHAAHQWFGLGGTVCGLE